jgi:OmpA-OmpF porin, OOP family
LRFNFDTIQHNGAAVPIASAITSISNSKGQANVDEEGTVVSKTSSNVGKALLGTGAGALIGGLAGGGKGAAIGAGAGAAVSIIAIEVAAKGPKVEFAPGSTFGLSVKSRGGPDLATLPPNPAGGAAPSPVPTASAAPAPNAAPASNAMPASNPAPAGGAAAASGAQPQLSTVRIDFVPGERTVFFDDFSDMAQDEPPPHWKLRGHPVELRVGGNIRELYSNEDCELTSPSFKTPANFTFEMDFTGQGETHWYLKNKDEEELLSFIARGEPSGQDFNASVSAQGNGTLGEGGIKADNTQPMHFALWVQQGRVRAYLNGTRILDVNQVQFKTTVDHIFAHVGGYRPTGLRSIRMAESAPDFSAMIAANGRYVTHGIYFDTDSDRLKPESAPVIKMIAQGLQKNPNLKIEIDGYTDSTGDAQHNQVLSQKRAEAVRSVLVSQFGIDGGRLTSGGFGAANPIGSNDTPDGRAQNRRVEFVKQ